MNRVVLDAIAVLALLQEERGGPDPQGMRGVAIMSAVNLTEVVGKLHDVGMPEDAIRRAVDALGLQIAPFTDASAYQAGLLYHATRRRGLSLGDRACFALGFQLRMPVVTA